MIRLHSSEVFDKAVTNLNFICINQDTPSVHRMLYFESIVTTKLETSKYCKSLLSNNAIDTTRKHIRKYICTAKLSAIEYSFECLLPANEDIIFHRIRDEVICAFKKTSLLSKLAFNITYNASVNGKSNDYYYYMCF